MSGRVIFLNGPHVVFYERHSPSFSRTNCPFIVVDILEHYSRNPNKRINFRETCVFARAYHLVIILTMMRTHKHHRISNKYTINESEYNSSISSDSEEESRIPSLSSESHTGLYQFEHVSNNSNQTTRNTINVPPDTNTNTRFFIRIAQIGSA